MMSCGILPAVALNFLQQFYKGISTVQHWLCVLVRKHTAYQRRGLVPQMLAWSRSPTRRGGGGGGGGKQEALIYISHHRST